LYGRLIKDELISPASRVLFVDDGSRDGTWQIISALAGEGSVIEGVKLANNAGHQNALWAGMMAARERADAIISIDADLQDDIEAIPEFIKEFNSGSDIVYGVRDKREFDSAFKRLTARGYYKFMHAMGVDLVYDHAEYRLMSRRALDALSEFSEVNLFLRGMVPLLGFKTSSVAYERGERVAGETKYPLNKMISLAVQGITSFSVKPIRWITFLGALFALLGAGIAVYTLITLALGRAVVGWASLMISIWIVGGAQLIALGLIGEYIGRVYTETKRRPRYIIEERSRGLSGPHEHRG
jgi:glycosyltransferase involved in cell wall biosynthesis